MILSHSKKFIFFRVAKTGSTTAEVMLRLSSAFDFSQDFLSGTREWVLPTINRLEERHPDPEFNWSHATPQDLIDLGVLTMEQLREYDCYAYVRPVGSRFVSGYMHCMRTGKWGPEGKHGLQPDQFMKRWREDHDKYSAWEIIGRDQTEWFFAEGEQVVQPLDFSNYQAELHRVLKALGAIQFAEIPRLNRSHQELSSVERRRAWAKAIWDDQPEVQCEVYERYANDIAFYQENFGEFTSVAPIRNCA